MAKGGQVHHSTARCVVCGRALSQPGHVVPGLGEVGPECRQRVEAIESIAQRMGLRDALYGGAWVPTEDSPEAILRVYGFILRAREAGLRVEVSKVPGGAWVHLRGVEHPKALLKALNTWEKELAARERAEGGRA